MKEMEIQNKIEGVQQRKLQEKAMNKQKLKEKQTRK